MIAEQRHNEILQILSHEEFVEVEDLSSRLGVSAMTIRRDLQKMDEAGLLRRQHGGASLDTNIRPEYDYEIKKSQNQAVKQSLAPLALKQVKDNDIIYMDAGTTVFELSNLLYQRQNLTVITNDLLIALNTTKNDINTILLGGVVQKATAATRGPITTEMLESFHVTTAFLGATAVAANMDVLSPTLDKAYLKKTALQVAQRSYLLVDNSKFNSYALYRFASLSDFTGIITDRVFSESEAHHFKALGVSILQNDGATGSSKGTTPHGAAR